MIAQDDAYNGVMSVPALAQSALPFTQYQFRTHCPTVDGDLGRGVLLVPHLSVPNLHRAPVREELERLGSCHTAGQDQPGA